MKSIQRPDQMTLIYNRYT